MSSNEAPPPLAQAPAYVQRWRSTWTEFRRALISTAEPFNAWDWTVRLVTGILEYLLHASGLQPLAQRHLSKIWRPAVPALAIFLVVLALTSYFVALRKQVIRPRWCPGEQENCLWDHFHTTIVVYLGIMILYHYITVIFQSPGVALKPDTQLRWSAGDSQGGLLGWNTTLDETAERHRVSLYGCMPDSSSNQDTQADADGLSHYPSTSFTFCNKCTMWRPPRCHHCNVCNRCILQMDHHCPWVNNCIGYNNLRAFFLALTYLVIGCWYGACMIAVPFHRELNETIKSTEGSMWQIILGGCKTGILDLPYPWTMAYLMVVGEFSPVMWVRLIFPLLFSVGVMLTIFWAYHLNYILSAQTTLEQWLRLVRERETVTAILRLNQRSPPLFPETMNCTTNPFDQGAWRNFRQVLGPQAWLLFLPLPVTAPPPFLPPGAKAR